MRCHLECWCHFFPHSLSWSVLAFSKEPVSPPLYRSHPPRAGPSSPDSHLLRVQSAFIGRRLSDNELMMPPKIRVAHSSASSPGETSTGSLPIRRHSSIGPERRGSTCANLSPPTLSRTLVSGGPSCGGSLYSPRRLNPSPPLCLSPQSSSLANASKSVPMLLTPSPGSKMGSRRQSTCSISSIGGLDSRRSSTASIGNPLGGSYKSHRRPSALISNSSSGNLLQQLSAGVVSTVSIAATHNFVTCATRHSLGAGRERAPPRTRPGVARRRASGLPRPPNLPHECVVVGPCLCPRPVSARHTVDLHVAVVNARIIARVKVRWKNDVFPP
ncbi:putative SCY1-like protein 2 [Penaeus vannamei]|uniref:Putative SCY1-like protein 2 n=1 Tax=Penaeus vannamei TaxID=6689 RepID=A0A3R7P0A4_PENVA|nr:putative SCY1-like protein 2 [Penaeus vannamei]